MVSFLVDLCAFSPNGLSLACVTQTEKRILVRRCDEPHAKLNVEHKFAVCTPVDSIQWSPDSGFIAASCRKHAIICIYSITIPNWKCKLSFGILDQVGGIGLEKFCWTPDARHLLCISSQFTFLSVWSIRNKCAQYLKDIWRIAQGHSFSPDGSLLAIAHTNDQCKPYIGIYSCKTWTKETSFLVASRDLAGISWSPNYDKDVLVCWDSNLFSNLYIYDILKGHLLKHYSPHGLSSGFKSVEWAPTGHFLVCTTHRNEIHVLNALTFGVLIHEVLEPSYAGSVEYDIFYGPNRTAANPKIGMSKYHRLSKWPPTYLEDYVTNDVTKGHKSPLPSWTVRVKINEDGNYLTCLTHLYPHVVWVYDLLSARLAAVLIHQNSVVGKY
ncbi:WD repeat-containing protein WRAP73 [Orchesella cincta]|uniref:WD repeat-containing protein WRAP73 n=1 Tax=Orchesella cincta TaxID=48709 RepID=A0A1D2MGJ5_ORCCI|nr:WD repeat-containing protein WRAP73 [Orchesella cincta]